MLRMQGTLLSIRFRAKHAEVSELHPPVNSDVGRSTIKSISQAKPGDKVPGPVGSSEDGSVFRLLTERSA